MLIALKISMLFVNSAQYMASKDFENLSISLSLQKKFSTDNAIDSCNQSLLYCTDNALISAVVDDMSTEEFHFGLSLSLIEKWSIPITLSISERKILHSDQKLDWQKSFYGFKRSFSVTETFYKLSKRNCGRKTTRLSDTKNPPLPSQT